MVPWLDTTIPFTSFNKALSRKLTQPPPPRQLKKFLRGRGDSSLSQCEAKY